MSFISFQQSMKILLVFTPFVQCRTANADGSCYNDNFIEIKCICHGIYLVYMISIEYSYLDLMVYTLWVMIRLIVLE